MNADQKAKLDRVAEDLRGVSPERVRGLVRANDRIIIRISATEKEEIREAAAMVGTSITDYLLTLHRNGTTRRALSAVQRNG